MNKVRYVCSSNFQIISKIVVSIISNLKLPFSRLPAADYSQFARETHFGDTAAGVSNFGRGSNKSPTMTSTDNSVSYCIRRYTCPLIAARACTAPCTAVTASLWEHSSSEWVNAGTFPRRWSKPPTLSARPACVLSRPRSAARLIAYYKTRTPARYVGRAVASQSSELRANIISPGEQGREFSHVGATISHIFALQISVRHGASVWVSAMAKNSDARDFLILKRRGFASLSKSLSWFFKPKQVQFEPLPFPFRAISLIIRA